MPPKRQKSTSSNKAKETAKVNIQDMRKGK